MSIYDEEEKLIIQIELLLWEDTAHISGSHNKMLRNEN